jgi:hypothetical protein
VAPAGTYLDEEDVVSASSAKRDDGLLYYNYEINGGLRVIISDQCAVDV